MDFTDAYRLTRKGVQHGFAYSPGSTFLATLHHLSDHDGLGLAMSSRHSSDGKRDAWRCSSSSSSGYGRSEGNDEKQQQRGCTLVQIRASSTLQVVRSWSLPFLSTAVRWSQDGTMLLLAGKNRFLVLVVDPRLAPTVRASIASDLGDDLQHDCLLSVKAGAEGMGAVSWIGGDAICSFSSDHLTATMWDVRSGRTTVTASTKTSRCYASPSNDHIAFLLRKDAADTAAILAHNSSHGANTASATFPAPWRTIEEFSTQTNDAIGLCWSPDERHVAVWEGILEHKLLIFSVLGHLQATLSIEVMHPQTAIPTIAEPIGHPSLSAGGLGIREVRWSPNGRFIAIGDYDDHVRLLETREWCECASFDVAKLAAKTSSRNGCEAIGWREPAAWLQHTGGRSIVGFESMLLPTALPLLKPDLDKLNPRAGICWMEWNATGDLLGIRTESVPSAVYIFGMPGRSDVAAVAPRLLSVIVLASPVSQAVWRPSSSGSETNEVAIVCQSQAVYFWRLQARTAGQIVEAIPIPIDGFSAVQLSFAPDGRTLLLASNSDTYCCAMDAAEDGTRVASTNDEQSTCHL